MAKKKKIDYVLINHYDETQIFPFSTRKKLKIGKEFKYDDVIYLVTIKGDIDLSDSDFEKYKQFVIKQVGYKIKNDLTTIIHHCPVKQIIMNDMKPEQVKTLKKKYGKKRVKAWLEKGSIKMHGMHLVNVCPSCECRFYKDEAVMPDTFEVTPNKGRKKLIKRE